MAKRRQRLDLSVDLVCKEEDKPWTILFLACICDQLDEPVQYSVLNWCRTGSQFYQWVGTLSFFPPYIATLCSELTWRASVKYSLFAVKWLFALNQSVQNGIKRADIALSYSQIPPILRYSHVLVNCPWNQQMIFLFVLVFEPKVIVVGSGRVKMNPGVWKR